MRRILFTATVLLLLGPSAASAQILLNTGYNRTNNTLLQFGASDPVWVKIASYEPPATAVSIAPARVINLGSPWGSVTTPAPGARWLGPRISPASSAGTNHGRPAYSIYRLCFCLLRGFANPTLSLDVRADDYVFVWLNNIPNILVAPQIGRYFASQGPPLHGVAQPQMFREGRNCLYVLNEDVTGNLGFVLGGTVNAAGLMPNLATGPHGNFGPCGCPSEPDSIDQGSAAPTAASAIDDSAAVAAIIQFAEGRRLQASARASASPAGGTGTDSGQ